MEIPTEFGRPYARVTWQVPDPTDNSDEPLRLSGLLPPQELKVGKRHITYTVIDSAGLSKSCTFSIVVKGTNDFKNVKFEQTYRLKLLIYKFNFLL